jgi:hypothetical protein
MPSLFDALEFTDWFRAAFGGWRFIFSASFRSQMRERWKHESWLYITADVLCGLAGIAFSLLIAYAVISGFAGWDWPQRALP